MRKEHTPQLDLTLEKVSESDIADYTDKDLVVFSDIRRMEENVASCSTDFTMLLFCQKGRIQLDINAAGHVVRANECMICPPRTYLDKIMVSLDFTGTLICLSHRLLMDTLCNSTDVFEKFFYVGANPVLPLDSEHMLDCRHYQEVLKRKTKDPACPYKQEIIRSLLRATIYELLSAIDRQAGAPGRDEPRAIGQGDRLAHRFLKMLNADKVKARFVTDYASRLCVTPKYLSAACKQATGKTASAWIDEFVVKDARHMLLYSNKSIKEISQELGFPNLSFFGKYVKAQLGVPPTAYRKASRKDRRKDRRTRAGDGDGTAGER